MSRGTWILLGLAVAVLLSLGAAVSFGSANVAFADVYRVLAHRAGLPVDGVPEVAVQRIVWDLRMPRVLLALAVGAGLALAGVGLQALVRNPLAEPYILGLSSGASAGASVFYLGYLPVVLSQALTLPLAAFVGGMATITVVYLVARSGNTVSVTRLLLAGVAMGALMAALTSFMTLASPDLNKMRALLFWLQGSMAGTRWDMLPLPLLATAGMAVVLYGLARPLDALLLGEEPAQHLGVPVEALKKLLVVLAALITGILVSAAGAIGFVGLIIPHSVRLFVGVAHRRVVPVSAFAGALFLLWADLAARTVLPAQELPVGVVTALCGVPFFLYLLRQGRYRFG